MRFDESIQNIGRKLDAGTMLVSDATIELLTILRANTLSYAPTISLRDVFYEEAMDALNKELLGYEKTEWDLSSGYRCCRIRTAKMVENAIHYIPNPISEAAFHMMWGSQQVEAFLSGVMDLSVFESGNQELVAREIRLLEDSKAKFHTESGIEDILVVFTGSELLRLYMQLRSAVSGLCQALFNQAVSEEFVATPPITTNTTAAF